MSRTSRVRVLTISAFLAAAGCQDYNFNPVSRCLVETGRKQVTLSDISTADVLFVVDDSGSMGGEQEKLSVNFQAFITNLDLTNQNRVLRGQIPIDFHVAITTTSVFENQPVDSNPYCVSNCPTIGGTVPGNVCCNTLGSGATPTPSSPFLVVEKCAGAGATCSQGECRNDCVGFADEWACCAAAAPHVPQRTQTVSCTNVGERCGALNTHYDVNSKCEAGNAQAGGLYPQGRFVAAGTNPKVLHFDKELYSCGTPPCRNKSGQLASDLLTYFSQNVLVGTCGSSQEAPLEAARRALDYWRNQPAESREWLHPNAKLVLVFVGDEDDCSSPEDANRGVLLEGDPGSDACVADADLPLEKRKLNAISDYVDFFSTLPGETDGNRPLGAAYVVSAKSSGGGDVCVDEACTPDFCCDSTCTGDANVCTTAMCGGQAKGTRMLEAAAEMRASQGDVVAGSICDPNFGTILDRVAEIVKPPSGLLLPSQPAAEEVTVLRITQVNSKSTRKTCFGPAPAELTAAEALAARYDWWFTTSREQLTDEQRDPSPASRYVYINHETSNCEASPGETYSADYLGRMPAGGCTGETPQAADDSCVNMLGGRPGDWTCFAGVDASGVCIPPVGTVTGTCLCGPRQGDICPNG